MPSVVFLRGVNVGGANRCQPARIAKQLAGFNLINIGAAGTFVAHTNAGPSVLRAAIAKKLPFQCEIMICPAGEIMALAEGDPFSRQSSSDDIVRFVSVGARRVRLLPPLPLSLPSEEDWGVKIIAIAGRFVLGLYRRQMKAIGHLGKLEKRLGVSLTTRNWNTMEKIMQTLRAQPPGTRPEGGR